MQNISNQTGRALEYAIVIEILNALGPFAQLTSKAEQSQKRDSGLFGGLPKRVQIEYTKSAKLIANWAKDKVELTNTPIIIDRLSDYEGVQGDVTDIRIKNNSSALNLSIKHNHAALKHQRPPSTAQWCGFIKGEKEDNRFRSDYNKILNAFKDISNRDCPKAVNFRDLKAFKEDYIDLNLYTPVCSLVCNFINNYCTEKVHVHHLFKFLIGNTDFYKAIDYENYVEILEFNNVPLPNSVVAECKNANYVILEFSNDWTLKMRIHTAASSIGGSLKFDTQPYKMEVPKTILKKL